MFYYAFFLCLIFFHSLTLHSFSQITAEDFICKGDSILNPPFEWRGRIYFDGDRGTLPARGIDNDLIELLNSIQSEAQGKLVILSGYRSSRHNSYLAAELYNYVDERGDSGNPYEVSMTSKHIMGAAADFYVTGFEERPDELLRIILGEITKRGDNSMHVASDVFLRHRSGSGDGVKYFYPSYRTDRWWIHPYAPGEGRDLDCRGFTGVYFHINKRLTFNSEGCDPIK
ncbi:hypothetical protein JW890_07065 [candidate division WOR-3 bacterium]|nr:hypothetical protein [candidate division WOR-3 bacterium]